MLLAAVQAPAGEARLGARQVHAAARAAHQLAVHRRASPARPGLSCDARSARRISQTASTTSRTRTMRRPSPDYLTGKEEGRKVVGATGFEPATPASRTQYSTRLSYAPTWVLRLQRVTEKDANSSKDRLYSDAGRARDRARRGLGFALRRGARVVERAAGADRLQHARRNPRARPRRSPCAPPRPAAALPQRMA